MKKERNRQLWVLLASFGLFMELVVDAFSLKADLAFLTFNLILD